MKKFFLNGPSSASFSFIFQSTVKFMQQTNVKHDPSRMHGWDSNTQPFEYQSPPITTRPWLPPLGTNFPLPPIHKTFFVIYGQKDRT